MKKIVLFFSLDYIGYGGVSLILEVVVVYKLILEIDDEDYCFKYCFDFS